MRTTILLIFSVLLIISCSPAEGEAQQADQPKAQTVTKAPSQAPAQPQLLGPTAFQEKLDQTEDAQLIDVRTPGELARGKLAGCAHIDINSADFKQRIDSLDREKPVFVYCAVGGRSGSAAKLLSAMGFQEIYDLKGGINAWNSAGMETIK